LCKAREKLYCLVGLLPVYYLLFVAAGKLVAVTKPKMKNLIYLSRSIFTACWPREVLKCFQLSIEMRERKLYMPLIYIFERCPAIRD
jgi:hypothetical protein